MNSAFRRFGMPRLTISVFDEPRFRGGESRKLLLKALFAGADTEFHVKGPRGVLG